MGYIYDLLFLLKKKKETFVSIILVHRTFGALLPAKLAVVFVKCIQE